MPLSRLVLRVGADVDVDNLQKANSGFKQGLQMEFKTDLNVQTIFIASIAL